MISFDIFRHQKREAEPKDNDLNKIPVRNMHISTYKHVATDGEVGHREENISLVKHHSKFSRQVYRNQLHRINKNNHFVNDHCMLNRNIRRK